MAASEFVTLSGGFTVSLDALRLGWSLEDRGFRMDTVGDKLRVSPHQHLTADDVAAIRANRDELLTLVQHVPETVA